MSEHYEGKLFCVDAGDKTEFDLDTEHRSTIASAGRGNARRLAAAWNACEGMTTKAIEALAGIGSLGDLKASELNVAHALLRELLDDACACGFSMEFEKLNPGDWENRARNYLDACDKPGETK